MKVVVIGGVAAGTKTAAKLKREIPDAEVLICTKSEQVSYAGCGLPYYVGGTIADESQLIVNTPEKYAALTGTEVRTGCEIVAIDPSAKNVTTAAGEKIAYDKLVIASGASPIVPAVEGVDKQGVFTVRTPEDAVQIRAYLKSENCRKAVVVGGGFIGLEVAENLMAQGLQVTVVDMAAQLMPGIFDAEMSDYIRRQLQAKGMRIMTAAALTGIDGAEKVSSVRTAVGAVPADLVVLAIGVRPATGFLEGSGVATERGLVVTDAQMRTNIDDIYAVGDCALVKNRITGAAQWSAMGSTANITGRLLAQNLSGTANAYEGCLGTAVVRLSDDLNAARTGLTEQQAKDAGFDVITAVSCSDDKASYYPDFGSVATKIIADRATGKLLGMQVVGTKAVDKMADIAVVGLSMGATVAMFETMDFAYAPPFSTAIHPFAKACTVLCNKLSGAMDSFTPVQYAAGEAKDYRVVDTMPAATIPGATYIDLTKAEEMSRDIPKDEKLLIVCSRGRRAYLLQNKLRALGFTNTKILEGGSTFNVLRKALPSGGKLPAAEIKRLKGLGCLQDKRYDDVFNVRVITRNGKITAEEHRAIAEASERFGSGAVTMTTRLTLEIQGVPYENVEPMIEFLRDAGLDTGGTGSLVRPVVSCKGTTCQYGLLDSFGLSEKLHERFYIGYHKVTLPHKFKIAVGGCPNNCVKPSLNDMGIIGQRVLNFDFSKCRGCKTCQVETGCPIKIAHLKDGKLQIDQTACNHCGRCLSKCPFGVTENYTDGYKVYIGGRWGKKVASGKPLDHIFTSEEELMDMVERAILFFRDEGITGERFSDTIERLGFDYVQDKLLHGEIKKENILEKNVTGGATC